MKTALTDLIRLAQITGRIPKEIPASYVLWAQGCHRAKKQPLRQNIICL